MRFLFYLIFFHNLNYALAQNSSNNKLKDVKLKFFKSFADSTKKHTHFELSFGQNLLFISSSKQSALRSKEDIVLATSAVLFFLEFRPQKILRIPLFLNIATESKQFIINGQLVNEKASPTIGTGLIFKAIEARIDDKSKVELEIGALASFIIDATNSLRVAPVLAARLKICRGENFVMYIGGNYSLGVNAFGIMYGTGTTF